MANGSKKENNQPKKKSRNTWLGAGIAIGVALGVALDNIALGIALGVVFGLGMRAQGKSSS